VVKAQPVTSDRRYRFAHPPADLWTTIESVDRYQSWWPWLTEFDGRSLAEGSVWRCRARSPLRYSVNFTIQLTTVDERERVAARVSGDLAGDAELTIAAVADGAEVRLRSQLQPASPLLSTLGAVFPALVRREHRSLLDLGARQLAAHLG
jgi:uncharacterized protein YndB with AHSA1/START domain